MEWYRLKVSGLKSSRIRFLMGIYKEYSELLNESPYKLKTILKCDRDFNLIQNSKKDLKEYEKLKIYMKEESIGLICLNDDEYPELLRKISKPPLFLFFKGDIKLLKSEKILSVVGTRRNTKYGENALKKIIKDLLSADITIVSGLAMGIDIIAHRETLKVNGNTIAVLGCGIDIFYPEVNKKERLEIEKKGLVISEFPLGTKPKPYNFPIRNRIISGISKGILIVESPLKGGSLITTEFSLDEGRDIFAIPGDIFSPMSKGCNNLIRDSKAKLILTGEDILLEYGWEQKNRLENEKKLPLGEKNKIFNILKTKMNLEEIKSEINLSTGELLSYLMELELEGFIQSLPGGCYIRKN